MDTSELKSFLSESQILSDSKNLEFYGKDWIHLFPANPALVVFPQSTQQVVQLVQWARKNQIVLVPSGGRTGLSGGATATQKEVIVSFEKMNQLIELNEFEETITVQAGMITKEVQKKAMDIGLMMPISFAAEGSSQIGGNVATNAGGIHVIQYGMMRRWVRGMEVVTGKGEVLKLGRHLIKDSAGYHLQQLFIGSEGTLALITEVTLALAKKPPPLSVFLLGLDDLNQLTYVYSQFKKNLSLYAFEMFTDEALKCVEKSQSCNSPLETRSPYYLLMEVQQVDQEKAMNVFEQLIGEEKITDGIVSQSDEQAQHLWSFRENISESISVYQPYKNDISVRISKLPEFLTTVQTLIQKEYPNYKVVWFGHVGDGNLHINILKPKDISQEEFVKNCKRVNDLLFVQIKDFGGSISAEHGVGLLKKDYLHYSRSQEEISYMRELKKVFDPDGILNCGKIVDV